MRCTRDRMAGTMRWSGCYSPAACSGFGYCRNRNVDAGGMPHVTPEMQAEWRRLDATPTNGVQTDDR